jgi:Co/Zn/Cd efflux system component
VSIVDTVANLGVIVAGALVLYFDSRVPDLVIGAIISTVVLGGGVRILRDASAERRGQTSAQ